MRVLEIGCASGITMYRVAPRVGLYYGTDLSRVIIDKNKQKVKAERYTNIKLSSLAAHEINGLEERDFDLVIINSVIQAFHGHHYLRKIIRQCIDVMGEKGYLFLGDIMDQDKKSAMVSELTAFKKANRNKNYTTKTDFSAELFLSRKFWEDLGAELEEIRDIQFSDKIYTIENELTKFRYDVLIAIDKKKPAAFVKKWRKQKHQDDLNIFSLPGFNSEPLHLDISADGLCYVIFTSGTTGNPRPVAVEHRGLLNYIDWRIRAYGYREQDITLQLLAYGFDGFASNFYSALLSGGKLLMVGKENIFDYSRVAGLVRNDCVTNVSLVPVMYEALLENGDRDILKAFRFVVLAGEKARDSLIEKSKALNPGIQLINEYGPTEATVAAAANTRMPETGTNVIGRPLDNVGIYILDTVFHLQPVGVAGELCISGIGVSRGYLNNPELTSERFLSVFYRFHGSYRTYISGDLARWLEDGNVEFLGRIDRQVKIRGYRIELSEIETRLAQHALIRDVVVIDREKKNGEKYLCAYLVGEEVLKLPELKDYLSPYLPEYMIPAYFIQIDKIPLTPNGKPDRKVLPSPEVTNAENFTAPRDHLEKKLVEIWSEVLNIDKASIGIGDNFFQLGGHSLKATMLTTKIHKQLGVNVPLAEVFKNQTIRGLGEIIKNSSRETFIEIEPAVEKEYYELSFNQKRLWIIHQQDPLDNSYNMMGIIIMNRQVEEKTVKWTVQTLIERHESLRTGFKVVKGSGVQYVIGKDNLPLSPVDNMDISSREESKKQSLVKQVTAEFNNKPFHLDEPPLFRSLLIKVKGDLYVFVYCMHHIVSDGWSMQILERDFHYLYNAYLNKSDIEPIPAKVTYKDFAYWHNRQLEKESIKGVSGEFWIKFLKGELPRLRLPVDNDIGGNNKTKSGASFRFVIPEPIKDPLKKICNQHQITLFTLMYSLYNIWLARVSGQGTVVSSAVNAGRLHPSLQDIVGFFVNSVIFRLEIKEDDMFIDFVKDVQETVLEFFRHQNYPLELVLDEVGIKYPEVAASFNMLNIGNNESVPLENPDSFHDDEIQNVKFDLEPYITEYSNGIEITVNYNRNLFKPKNIEYMMEKYRELINFFALNPGKQIKEYKETKKRRSFKKN
jgi:fengycin family lipopeptide synthetase D